MKSLRKTFLLVCGLLLAAALTRLGAQAPQQGTTPAAPEQSPQAPPQENRQGRIIFSVNQVVVPVTVKDGSGKLVADLRRDEFRIFEDNVEQKIVYFGAEPAPISMVLLIDNDLKSKDAKQVSESLLSVVAGLSLKDEAFVCRFDQFFHEGKGFISDQDKLLTELKRTHLDDQPSTGPSSPAISNGPSINGHSAMGDAPNIAGGLTNIKGQPTKALDDAVYAAAQLLKDRDPERQRRKIIFLISDGVNGPKFNVNKYDTVLKELLRYNIAVYGVGVGSAFFERRFERLSKYAHDTGGDVYYGLKSRAMEELYARVTEEARNQYTLAYAPSGTDRGAEYHSIEVRVTRPGLTILTREGYYAGATPR
ncbi:MAG TPA: VWA domain-containing protein [Candidatus Acidoferrum sp.]|nr:VWA domain-containing protein [Candidatus Acidoferrum sp.]